MKKYYINLTEQERSQIIHSLIDKKNALMAQAYFSSLPVKDIEKNLNDNGIPSSVSYGADNE